ncbi:UNVERIFIED_CONTAM: Retrovirus-related Pol polyprotein from transposon RE1 [Sesamum calycinum]|uniref:Retrovirus-related Pol polyprotein from transposon RE1 n=1 Tax=Sesamum calycinum TaxID=2727403 RepID=A0AAW2LA20_9LAMI
MEQRKRTRGQTGQRALNANREIGEGSSQGTTTSREAGANWTKLIRLELRRLMHGEEQGEEVSTNFVDYEDFAGFGHGRKGYKVLNLDTNAVFITRDVTFHEEVFPFRELNTATLPCPLPVTVNDITDDSINSKKPVVKDIPLTQLVHPIQQQSAHLRRSSRQINRPAWMDDFDELKNFIEAQEKLEWREAMQLEVEALQKNGTWMFTELPPGKKPIGYRWIYKIKLRPDRTVDWYKARLVAKGYNQVEGVDYNDCFAHVAKAAIVRVFLAVTTARGWPLSHLDINNTFLHETLDENIYMEAPEGYETEPGKVCKLKKSLYGLKQASREWNQKFTEKVEAFGSYNQSMINICSSKR